MILLSSLSMKDFLSHRDTTIDFSSPENLLIDGSSGAGKSSIFDAIIWALYGKGRVDNRSMIRRGEQKATVTLTVVDRPQNGPETFWRLERSITTTGKHTLTVGHSSTVSGPFESHELTGLKDLQEFVETTLIGASYILFVNSAAYVQGNAESFVTQTAQKRKDLLLEIIKASDFDEYYEKSKEMLATLNGERQYIVGRQRELQSFLNALERSMAMARPYAELEAELHKLEARSRVLDTEEQVLSNKQNELRQMAEQNLGSFKTRIETADALGKARAAHLEKKPSVTQSITLTAMKSELATYSAKPVCPSGGMCPYFGMTKQQIERLETKIAETEQRMLVEQGNFDAWAKEYEQLPVPEDILKITKEIEEYKETGNGALYDVNQQLKSVRDEKYTNGSLRSTVAAEMKQAADNQKKRLDFQTQVKKISDQELPLLDNKISRVAMIKDAFGSKGIKTVAVDYILPRLEDQINDILSKLSEFRIHLDTQKASTDGESVVEGLWITIVNESGQELPYESYSGGEKLKIQVAIAEALATLQKVGFRLFDEAIVALDENSEEGFVQVLQKLQKGFPQVLLISHLQSIKELFDKKVSISKLNGISYVR